MIQALFQTISNFFIDVPSIGDLLGNISSGETNVLGGVISAIAGIFKKDEQ